MIHVREEMCPQNHPCPTLRFCPAGAITQQGMKAPEIDQEKCISCCACVQRCPAFEPEGCCGEE